MSVTINITGFIPTSIFAFFNQAYLETVQAALESEVNVCLKDQKDITTTDAFKRFKNLIKSNKLGKSQRNQLSRFAFRLANQAYLKGGKKTAVSLIGAVHKKVTGYSARVLDRNFQYARQLFVGTPYNYGGIDANGRLVLEAKLAQRRQLEGVSSDTVLGLNCIRMNNIFTNLVAGVSRYTYHLADPDVQGNIKKGSTNEDIYTKRELWREGLYPFPVVENYPAGRLKELPGLLALYGSYFGVQIYLLNAQGRVKPAHTVFVYPQQGQCRVLDTLCPGGFNERGGLSNIYKNYANTYSLTFNLVDTWRARPVKMAKSAAFLRNIEYWIKKAIQEGKQLAERKD